MTPTATITAISSLTDQDGVGRPVFTQRAITVPIPAMVGRPTYTQRRRATDNAIAVDRVATLDARAVDRLVFDLNPGDVLTLTHRAPGGAAASDQWRITDVSGQVGWTQPGTPYVRELMLVPHNEREGSA